MNVRLLFLMVLSGYAPAVASDNVVTNGGFEAGLSGWRVWSRAPDAIASALDTQTVHRGQTALRLEHRGAEDWSLEPTLRLKVQPGELLELECWIKVQGGGVATLCASTWDTQGKVVAWSYGERAAYEGPDWQHLQTRFVVPANVRQIQPRLIGYGPATVWVDDYAAVRRGNLAALSTANLPATLALRNALIEVTFNTADGALSVQDLRAGRRWAQKPFSGDCFVKDARVNAGRLQCTLFHGGSGLELSATLQLEGERPELLLELSAQGEMPASLRFPHPFVGEPGDYLVVPMNEGIPACSRPWRKSGSSIRTWTCSSAR